MDSKQELQVQQKRQVEDKEEATISTRAFLPNTDIYETEDALNVVMEMPGVEKSNVEVGIEDGVLKVYGQIDFSKYERLSAGLHGIQYRSLREELSLIEQDRPDQDPGANERWRPVACSPKGRGGKAARDFCDVMQCLTRRVHNGIMISKAFIVVGGSRCRGGYGRRCERIHRCHAKNCCKVADGRRCDDRFDCLRLGGRGRRGQGGISVELRAVPRRRWKGERTAQR